jgi:hypothetical protein
METRTVHGHSFVVPTLKRGDIDPSIHTRRDFPPLSLRQRCNEWRDHHIVDWSLDAGAIPCAQVAAAVGTYAITRLACVTV